MQVQACGVCHTDLHYREGAINDDFPFLLGHEAAGIVEAVGDDVDGVAPGDFVILNWRAVCGECRVVPAGPPLVLLRHAQRDAEDDARRRHAALARARHRRVRREDARRRRARRRKVDPGARPEAAGPARLRRDGRPRRGDATPATSQRGDTRRGVRLRRRRRRRDRRRAPRRARATIIAVDLDDASSSGRGSSAPPTPSTRRRPTRSRRSARSPTATAPTCASRRSATRGAASRRSSPATSPARSCRSACPTRR